MAKTEIKPLKDRYVQEISKQLASDLKIKNDLALPSFEKVVVNIGAGKAKEDESLIGELSEMLAAITGQKPRVNKARIAVSNFKIREGQPIGLTVTLRGKRMWYFLDKLINIALPRTKDFRGISDKSFDGRGNYSLGLEDQTIFPEVDTSKNIRLHGLQISIITTARDDESGLALLKAIGMPFRKK
jgi:large subunit ribosomal protein L5